MAPELHSLLGPSSAERWLNCTPSPRLTEHMPDSGNPYAAAGTLAHAIAELKGRKYFGIPEPMSTREFNKQLKKLKENPGYDKVMDAATDLYLEHLKARAMSFGPVQPFVALETRVDYSNLVPEGFGTADCIMIGAGRLEVVDYKNGAGVPVSAEANYQMMLYALGALNTFYFIYGDTIHTVHFSIVQPNAGGVKEWECQVKDLAEWGGTVVRPAAELAWAGEGEFVPGDWCRFCKAKAQCSARAKVILELGGVPHALEPADTAGPLLTDSQLGDALTRGRALAAWASNMEKYALTAALEGRTITGYKVVEGRGSREWAGGTDAAFAQLTQRGVEEALLYERKPVTVAGLEKALGKTVFGKTAEGLVTKLPGGPALAQESDERPPYNAAAIAFGGGSGG